MMKDQSAKVTSAESKDCGAVDNQRDDGTTYDRQLGTEWPIFALPDKSEALVLASGGLDSSTLLALLISLNIRPTSLFIDYQQSAAIAEEAAITSICQTMGVPLRIVRHEGTRFGGGEIRGRNAFLLHTGLLEFPVASGMIVMGIHAGTGYVDCSPDFVEVMQRSFDLHTGGSIAIVTPFLTWSKGDIWRLAVDLGAPIEQTYSCESNNQPCGSCNSCMDRQALTLEQFRACS